MANATPTQSLQYIDQVAEISPRAKSSDIGSKLRYFFSQLTFTAASTTPFVSLHKMMKLPAGKARVITDLSRIICPAGTATADLHVGNAAYTKNDGTAGAADDNSLADNVDVGGGAIDQALTLPTAGFLEFDSRDGVDIEVLLDTEASPAAGVMYLMLAVMMGN